MSITIWYIMSILSWTRVHTSVLTMQLGFLTVWQPQSSQTSHMVAQGSRPEPANKMEAASPFMTQLESSYRVKPLNSISQLLSEGHQAIRGGA